MLPTDAPTYVCTYLYSLPTEEAHALPTSSCTDHLLQYDSACTNKADRSNQWSHYSRPNEIKNQSHATSVGWFEGCSQETLLGSCCLRKKLGRTQWEFFYPITVSVMILWYALAHVLQLFRCFGDYTATFISECTVSDQFQCCPLHTLWALNSILNMVPNTGCPDKRVGGLYGYILQWCKLHLSEDALTYVSCSRTITSTQYNCIV